MSAHKPSPREKDYITAQMTGEPKLDAVDPGYDEFAAQGVARGDLALMDFGSALGFLKSGGCVSRADWNGPGQFLTLQQPDWGSLMTLPYIFITTVRGDRVPWLASQTDLLRNDWYIVDTAIDTVQA